MAEEKTKFDIAVRISDDYYKAYVSIEFYGDGSSIKSDDIIKILKAHSVKFNHHNKKTTSQWVPTNPIITFNIFVRCPILYQHILGRGELRNK